MQINVKSIFYKIENKNNYTKKNLIRKVKKDIQNCKTHEPYCNVISKNIALAFLAFSQTKFINYWNHCVILRDSATNVDKGGCRPDGVRF